LAQKVHFFPASLPKVHFVTTTQRWAKRNSSGFLPHQNKVTPSGLKFENRRLNASWDCFSAEHLERYLTVDEQDQRINVNSILTRALVIDTLWPGKFGDLINEELRFGVIMTWLMRQLRLGRSRSALVEELSGSTARPGTPDVVRQTYGWLQTDECPLPDYLGEALAFAPPDGTSWSLAEVSLSTFYRVWSRLLSDLASERISVLEVACGSGNDYHGIRECGLSSRISYSGFDISSKNIRNARRQYPGVDFFQASILNSGIPDGSFEYVFVHDLLEHLSPKGLALALEEILRIAQKEVWLHCFNVNAIDRHEIRLSGTFYRNKLSITCLSAALEELGASTQVIRVSDLLFRKFRFAPDYFASCGTVLARILPGRTPNQGARANVHSRHAACERKEA
jgi:SAM-dependent methyltransferase